MTPDPRLSSTMREAIFRARPHRHPRRTTNQTLHIHVGAASD